MTMTYLLFKPQLNGQLLRGGLPDLIKLSQNPTVQGNSILWCFLSSPFQNHIKKLINWVQFISVAQSCPTLYDPMDCSTPVFPVHHQLSDLTQTHVHWISDAIQPSYPLASPSPAFNLSQSQGLFKWISSSHQVAKVLEFQLHYQSF